MTFVSVATVDEIVPGGEPIVVEIGRRWVAVFNVAGEFYAIEDVCTHDDGPLAEGKLCDHIIECPRHGAKFDVRTGKVLSAPALVDVPTYELKIEGNEILIGERRK